ncbi:archaemetzincin [Archaeoglobus veneficus]|uniref:Peptidase zinc-dependent n=1 Tax=Archaeoglobus veneficus (strain DSM 11195 / SNP6) TaxID=693661 RepID=F2KPA6_ARCVS|nr:archaemetzincin [Archaeoglobus veneficus]AEA47510.1 peptidase zinc-dependent [Archaeoglobus veneficus SNP6]
MIALVPFGRVDGWLVERIERLAAKFFFNLSVFDSVPAPSSAYDHARRQYNASELLLTLRNLACSRGFQKVLGITSEDLYYGSSLFVFGCAEFGGTSAVISTCRLKAESEGLFASRVFKEVLHELGHLFGLEHCMNDCVMTFCERLDQIDVKKASYCSECLEKLTKAIENVRQTSRAHSGTPQSRDIWCTSSR